MLKTVEFNNNKMYRDNKNGWIFRKSWFKRLNLVTIFIGRRWCLGEISIIRKRNDFARWITWYFVSFLHMHGTERDETNFEPDSLSTIIRRLQRFFSKGYENDIISHDKRWFCINLIVWFICIRWKRSIFYISIFVEIV